MTNQPGSWANGAAVIRMQLRERIGPEAAASVTVSDGSGLSRDNIITPSVMTSWLAALSRDSRIAPAFIASVPLAKEEGNMVKRFRGRKLLNEVRCKSGYINGVRTLSGYVIHPGTGRLVAFSILVNDIPPSVPGSRVKEFHEDIVVEIDQWLAAQTRTAAGTPAR
jgi:D-alanyl-D-alanine carboxypeptidase/D-alanyl-D-alanine-endopeptidase (penicillin-binding protein 4)